MRRTAPAAEGCAPRARRTGAQAEKGVRSGCQVLLETLEESTEPFPLVFQLQTQEGVALETGSYSIQYRGGASQPG